MCPPRLGLNSAPISCQSPTSPHLAKNASPSQLCCMTYGCGPFSSQPPSILDVKSCSSFAQLCHDNTITWLPVPHALYQGCVSGKMNFAAWQDQPKGSSSPSNQALLPFFSSYSHYGRNLSPCEITVTTYLHWGLYPYSALRGNRQSEISLLG